MAQGAGKDVKGKTGIDDTKTKKGQGKAQGEQTIRSHLQYIEQSPDGLKNTDLIDEYWFISTEGKVIVEPPKHYRTGKYKAYVWTIVENFRKKKHRKSEVIISHDYYLNPEHYKFWPRSNLWQEHADIGEGIKSLKSVDSIKSMLLSSAFF